MIYGEFAHFYDPFMEDAPYNKWRSFLYKACEVYGIAPRRVADIGAGTGTLALLLAEDGLDVTAVDASEEMLAVAQQKSLQQGRRLSFLHMDMTELHLPNAVDALVSFCDCLNYLPSIESVKQAFQRFYQSLVPGGMLAFDVHTIHKARDIAGDNVFYEISDEASYIWQSSFDPIEKLLQYDVNFFVRDDHRTDLYRRFSEHHQQRIFEVHELIKAMQASGFVDIRVDFDFEQELSDVRITNPSNREQTNAERLFLTGRRPGMVR